MISRDSRSHGFRCGLVGALCAFLVLYVGSLAVETVMRNTYVERCSHAPTGGSDLAWSHVELRFGAVTPAYHCVFRYTEGGGIVSIRARDYEGLKPLYEADLR